MHLQILRHVLQYFSCTVCFGSLVFMLLFKPEAWNFKEARNSVYYEYLTLTTSKPNTSNCFSFAYTVLVWSYECKLTNPGLGEVSGRSTAPLQQTSGIFNAFQQAEVSPIAKKLKSLEIPSFSLHLPSLQLRTLYMRPLLAGSWKRFLHQQDTFSIQLADDHFVFCH